MDLPHAAMALFAALLPVDTRLSTERKRAARRLDHLAALGIAFLDVDIHRYDHIVVVPEVQARRISSVQDHLHELFDTLPLVALHALRKRKQAHQKRLGIIWSPDADILGLEIDRIMIDGRDVDDAGIGRIAEHPVVAAGADLDAPHIVAEVPVHDIGVVGHEVEIDQLLDSDTELLSDGVPVFLRPGISRSDRAVRPVGNAALHQSPIAWDGHALWRSLDRVRRAFRGRHGIDLLICGVIASHECKLPLPGFTRSRRCFPLSQACPDAASQVPRKADRSITAGSKTSHATKENAMRPRQVEASRSNVITASAVRALRLEA
ncbi:hypothetical protein, partial [Bradyrhizobium elkanii]|uniref:hypothetical protein n=1 Tax=Bradyrhizobium elkanii TaxID=29448 RepID=UPI00138ACFFB